MVNPSELVGSFVVEVGIRQAWTFVTFCDNAPTPPIERRLYIESGIEVRPPPPSATGEALTTQVVALSVLNGLTVVDAHVDHDGRLRLSLTEGAVLIVDGEADEHPSIEPWWLR